MPINWHKRFSQQATWTSFLRKYIFRKINLENLDTILEVGCGTGAILEDLSKNINLRIFGLDRNYDYLKFAAKNLKHIHYIDGDANHLPISDKFFDATICHYLLLWVENPIKVISEMKRVTRSNGYVIAFAEPDYGGRIFFPEQLEQLAKYQVLSLKEQGADPFIGRKLKSIFNLCGLHNIETGVIGAEWIENFRQDDLLDEWAILKNDLRKFFYPQKLEEYEQLFKSFEAANDIIMFIPTFYAIGRVV